VNRNAYQRAWQAAHPGYKAALRRIHAARRTPHRCPGTDARGCLVTIPGDRLHCYFCARTLALG